MNTIYSDRYKEVQNSLSTKYGNIMSVPRIEKVTLNMGIKELMSRGEKTMDFLMTEMHKITAQKAQVVRVKKSCDSFSIRKGDINALRITLRGKRMNAFLQKLLLFGLPRSKDFSGFSCKSFDGRGNFSFGINDCTMFYEVDRRSVLFIFGFNITVTTTAQNNEDAKEMLSLMHFPFV